MDIISRGMCYNDSIGWIAAEFGTATTCPGPSSIAFALSRFFTAYIAVGRCQVSGWGNVIMTGRCQVSGWGKGYNNGEVSNMWVEQVSLQWEGVKYVVRGCVIGEEKV